MYMQWATVIAVEVMVTYGIVFKVLLNLYGQEYLVERRESIKCANALH